MSTAFCVGKCRPLGACHIVLQISDQSLAKLGGVLGDDVWVSDWDKKIPRSLTYQSQKN